MTRWGFLSTLVLLCQQFCFAQQPAQNSEAAMIGSDGPLSSVLTYEQHKQAAIRINELAGRIHSEADASIFVSEIAGLFARELPPAWASSGIQQRVAHAEYETIRNPAKLIPQLMWARGNQTIWTMPNGYALGSDGKVAEGCRALEAIRVMHDLEDLFQNLRVTRDRLRRGIVPSEEIKKRVGEPNPQLHGTVRLEAHADTNPTHPAEQRYVQEHGSGAYAQLLVRLFDELFPAN
jgi:hypothetical protein